MERRGRGESGDADEYELEREFADVAAVVNSLDESVTLLGHSFGALCSLEAALRTDNLRQLLLYEPPLAVGDHESYSEELHAEMEALLADGEKEQVLVLFLREVAMVPPAEIDTLRSTPNWQNSLESAHTIVREYAAQSNYEFDAARFEGMITPTVLLSGSESPDFLKDATDALNDALQNSRIVILEGIGHDASMTAPERYANELITIIREDRSHR
jgi:pimeloyl-ACP methyl ester carboxylesterase